MRYILAFLFGAAIYASDLIEVSLTSDPPGAQIQIDSTMAGQTPANLKLPAGEYRIILTAKGFETWDHKVTVTASHSDITAVLRNTAQPPSPPKLTVDAPALPVISTDGRVASTKAPEAPQYYLIRQPKSTEVVTSTILPEPQKPPQATERRIRYEVYGTGSASLTYRNASGGTEQRQVTLPWEMTFTGRTGQFLYLSAQKQHAAYNLYCEEHTDLLYECLGYKASRPNANPIQSVIVVDGVSIQTATSNAPYGIASVSGRVP